MQVLSAYGLSRAKHSLLYATVQKEETTDRQTVTITTGFLSSDASRRCIVLSTELSVIFT